jgi:site-specific recombinase XerD
LDTGRWVEKSTGLRIDNALDTGRARRLAQKASAQERQFCEVGNTAFAHWVPQWLADHGAQRAENTRRSMQIAWQAVKLFIQGRGIVHPRQVKHEHAAEYMRWRQATILYRSRKVGHNTALKELKFFAHLLNEAVRRAYCEANLFARLGIAREAAKEKPELTDTELRKLLRESRKQPKWLERSIWISAYTGCRFSECAIKREHIDLRKGTLTLFDAKRADTDRRKVFTIPMAQQLRPMFKEMQRNRESVTCRLTREKNARANYFFRQCGINASFHSLRVTFVTRCHRAGLSESEAMRLVNHSSQLVHTVYSRLNVEDARAARDRILLPTV